jgi:hypothetical protein
MLSKCLINFPAASCGELNPKRFNLDLFKKENRGSGEISP